ncbi:hypothetical protein [Haloarcula sp. Atlit-7R]|uniref:hypothetical protein n=1 Tax=Haloarcula sp. Atlit-7R TaxID=2282125 RepID=UPI0011C3799E|nr:hypothetical protein [Haloarcula sp. Atlit-7R]
MSDDALEVSIRPPCRDDQWALLGALFIDEDYKYRHVSSKEDAISILTEAIENPSMPAYWSDEPSRDTIEFDTHPDYSNSITHDDLSPSTATLTDFGVKSDRFPDGNWREAQPEYEQVKEFIDSSASDEVWVVTDDKTGTGEWPWNKAVWVSVAEEEPPTDGADTLFSVWAHWSKAHFWYRLEVPETVLIQLLQGFWNVDYGEDLRQYQQFRDAARRSSSGDSDAHSLYEWCPGTIESAHRDGTPFSEDWSYIPKFPDEINGWEYVPGSVYRGDVWSGPEGDREVQLKHNCSDFSFGSVRDRRFFGTGASVTPSQWPSKIQSEWTIEESREAAVQWMENHDPELWSHPAWRIWRQIDTNPPGNYTVKRSPHVGNNGKKIAYRLRQDIGSGYTRSLSVEGSLNDSEWVTEIGYYKPKNGGPIHREQIGTFSQGRPYQSLQRAVDHIESTAKKMDYKGLSDEEREWLTKNVWDTTVEKHIDPLPEAKQCPVELNSGSASKTFLSMARSG